METRGEAQKVARWRPWMLAGLMVVLVATGPVFRTLAQPSGGGPKSHGQQTGYTETGRRITLRIYNYAQIPSTDLTRAEQVAGAIFHKAGIETAWIDCPLFTAEFDHLPACQKPLTASQFALRLLAQPLASRSATHREDMGSALTCKEEQVGCSAYVFYLFVTDWAKRSDASASEILGHALAHEVGHLLLGPDSHSPTGIMRGDWSMNDLGAMARTYLNFTPGQCERLQREVSFRGREQEQAPANVAAVAHNGDSVGENLGITVAVYNYAQVPSQTLERGEKEAARIFHEVGVDVSWRNCDPATTDIHLDVNCTQPAGPLNLALRILPSFGIVQGVSNDKTMGLAFGNFASVSFRWIREEAVVVGSAPSEILGPAIAHELGHLLLRQPGHSRVGIMRARWSHEDFQRVPLGTFTFTAQQGQSIRAEVRKRAQAQASVGLAAAPSPK